MEPNNGLGGGGMLSGINSGVLGIDHNNPSEHQQQQQQNPHHMHHQAHMVLPFGSSSHHDTDTHQQQQPINKHGNYPPFSAKDKHHHQQGSSLSDEEDPDTISGDPNKRNKSSSISPWQRMKWTDTMVRLLIMAVYYIGDEGAGSTSEGITSTDPNGNNKKAIKPFTGLLQKKGKWKSVSRAMMEKGFYVSPQQCEDKFNDLNKRYKRVNDILGKGTACKVVENQKLLDTMDHLSPKVKEEVGKLLNSKHLFFREMCAYHNSCGHGANSGGGGGGSVLPQQVEDGNDASQAQQQQQQQGQEQQQKCFHSSDEGVANLDDDDDDDDDDGDDEDDDDESENYSDDDEDESGEGGSKGHQGGHGNENDQEDNEDNDHGIIRPLRKNKRSRKAPSSTSIGCSIMSSSSSLLMQQLSNEVSGVFQDGGKSIWEKKQWLRSRIVKLEEKQVSYESQGFELEKQKLKWKRFSSKKEREMEKAKLENERRRLENERMVLLIRQKELELMKLQQQQQHSPT